MRAFGGIVAGLIVGFVAIWLVSMIGYLFYPIPTDLNPLDYDAVGVYLRAAPFGALALVVLSWFVGALAGGLVAVAIARAAWPAWLIAALVAFAGILNILMIPHPVWMQLSAVIAPAVAGLIAHHFGQRFHVPPTAPVAEAERA